MKIKVETGDALSYKGDALIVNLFEGVEKPGGATGAVDKAIGGTISKLIKRGEFTGKKGSTAVVFSHGKIGAERVIVVGLGKKEKFTVDSAREATAAALHKAKEIRAEKVGGILHGAGDGGISLEDAGRAATEGAILGLYKFDKYRSKDEKQKHKEAEIKEFTIIEKDAARTSSAKKGAKTGEILAASANLARDLVNEPPNVLTPTELANRAKAMAAGRKLSVKVYNKKEIEKMGMNAFLGVARGSAEPPVFITIEYKGDPKSEKTAAFIGKGLTFDSGGLSLKPANAMDDMKCDMAGAAAVIGALDSIEKLGLKINITGIIPATENMPGCSAQKIGDIVRAMNGKSIEIMNTDAEGRLILCDAICWAVKHKMDPIIDLATLTGACVIALGTLRTGLFSGDDELADAIAEAGASAGEKMWRMPIDDEYAELIKSDNADIKNVGNRTAGATTAALFLKAFTGDAKWAHLDIAGPAFLSAKQGLFIKGGTGVGARTLALLAMKLK